MALEKNLNLNDFRIITKSLLFGLLAFLIWLAFWNDYEFAFLMCCLVFLISLIYISKESERKKQQKAKEIEAKLPFALLQIANYLEVGVDFENSLLEVSKTNKDELSKALNKAISNHYSTGLSLDEAVISEALKTNSKEFLQAASRLSLVYKNAEGKKSGLPLRKMAFEILGKQKIEIKDFMGKAQSTSIGFIAVSAVFPSLLLAFAGIGSTFMEMPFTENQFFLIICVIIPLLNAIAVIYMVKELPSILRRFE